MRKQKNYWISEKVIEYVSGIAKENNESEGKALERIILEHAHIRSRKNDEIANAVVDKIKNDLTRIRLGTNTIDRNVKVLIEMLNHIFVTKGEKDIVTTDIRKSIGLLRAEETVKKRIQNLRVQRLEKIKEKVGD